MDRNVIVKNVIIMGKWWQNGGLNNRLNNDRRGNVRRELIGQNITSV